MQRKQWCKEWGIHGHSDVAEKRKMLTNWPEKVHECQSLAQNPSVVQQHVPIRRNFWKKQNSQQIEVSIIRLFLTDHYSRHRSSTLYKAFFIPDEPLRVYVFNTKPKIHQQHVEWFCLQDIVRHIFMAWMKIP